MRWGVPTLLSFFLLFYQGRRRSTGGRVFFLSSHFLCFYSFFAPLPVAPPPRYFSTVCGARCCGEGYPSLSYKRRRRKRRCHRRGHGAWLPPPRCGGKECDPTRPEGVNRQTKLYHHRRNGRGISQQRRRLHRRSSFTNTWWKPRSRSRGRT